MAESDKRSSGEPFKPPPAKTWNAMVDAGEQYLASQFNSGAPERNRQRETDIIKVKNSSGADRAKGEVLGDFGKSLGTVTAEHLRLTGTDPEAGKSFGILLQALPDGEIGRLQVSGACMATVTIGDTSHQFANIDPGAYKLVSADSGPIEILYAPASTGDQECAVKFGSGGIKLYRFTLTSGWTTGSASASIKEMDGTAVESSTVEDPDGLFSNLESSDDGLAIKQGGTYWTVAPDGGGGGGGSAYLFRFTLTGSWSSGAANADIKQMDGTAVASSSVEDPEGIFAGLGSGDTGLCLLQGSTYFVTQAGCPS